MTGTKKWGRRASDNQAYPKGDKSNLPELNYPDLSIYRLYRVPYWWKTPNHPSHSGKLTVKARSRDEAIGKAEIKVRRTAGKLADVRIHRDKIYTIKGTLAKKTRAKNKKVK